MIKGMKWGGMMLASLLMVSSCQNEEIVDNEGRQAITLTVSKNMNSRTAIDGDKTVWSEGDKIYVSSKDGKVTGVLTLTDGAGDPTGTFSGFVFGNPSQLAYSVYPAPTSGTTLDLANISASGQLNAPMVGAINQESDVNVQFRNQCGILYVSMNGSEGKTFSITAEDVDGEGADATINTIAFAGSIDVTNIDWTNGVPSLIFSNPTNSITVTNTNKAGEENSKVMYVPYYITNDVVLDKVTFAAKNATMNDEPVDFTQEENGFVGVIVKSNINDLIYSDTEIEKSVATVNGVAYSTLQSAIEAVEDGGTVTLADNLVFTEDNRTYNSGKYYDGLYYIGDKSFTIDLNGNTINQDGSVNDYLLNFKNDGEKENVINITNGTLDAGTTAYCALCTSTSSTQNLTINLEDINLINNNSNGSTIKIRGEKTTLNVKEGTVITGKDSYLGIENWNAIVNIYDGAEIYMNGTSSYNGCLVGVGGNGTVNVYGGYGKGVSGGLIAMISGGTINVEGGEWIANTDGTNANGNKSVLVAQSEKGAKSIINVTGGKFKGGYNCYGDAVGDAQINISGGDFNADPSSYVVNGYSAIENQGYYVVPENVKGIIKTADDLVALGGTKVNGTYMLMADLDMAGKEMKSMEVSGGATVNFIGNGHVISNLNLNAAGIHGMTGAGNEVAGLFDLCAPATTVSLTVSDLTITEATVSCSGYAAAIVGYNPNGGTVITLNNVDVNVATVTSDTVAALVGYTTGKVELTGCDVSSLSLTGEVGRTDKVGAFVGTANTATCAVTTSNCTNNTTYNDYGRVINGAIWNGK